MCGISAYLGRDAAFKALYMTIYQLERGKLGSGVAFIKSGRITIKKSPEDPRLHLSRIYYELDPEVNIAIGHNRLPSKGPVCYENTHPFLGCSEDIAMVHNGSVFNEQIKPELLNNGHKIKGETDSELLLHRLEDLVKEKKDMVKAIKELIIGEYNGAMLVLTQHGEVYGVRDRYHPIVIAERQNEIAVASTERAIRSVFKGQRKFLRPKPYQVFMIKDHKIRLFKPVEPQVRFYEFIDEWFHRPKLKGLWPFWWW